MASSVSLLSADSAAVMSDAIRLLEEMTLPSCSTVRAASVASSCERLADPRMALIVACASIIAGLAAATKPDWALRSARYSFSWLAAASSRSLAAAPRLLMVSSIFFTVSLSADTTSLSAPSSMISPSFSSAICWVACIVLVRCCSASSLREASSAGPWLARAALWVASCRLAASLGMSRPLRSIIISPSWPSTMPAPALMTMAIPAIPAKAANRLPRIPHRRCRSLNRPNLPDVAGHAMRSPRPSHSKVESRAAVSRYLVNKIGKMPWILLISPRPNKRPAQGRPFLFRKLRSDQDQYLATTGPPRLPRLKR